MANGIEFYLKIFKENKIDPSTDGDKNIPDLPGNYIMCLRKGSKLPQNTIKPILNNFQGLEVIYLGLASKSLRKRDFRQHFKGNAGGSTLRKSLGSLMGYKKIMRDKDEESTKTKFNSIDEAKLSKWMRENLIMFVCATPDYDKLEKVLIQNFNPPLNLKSNKNEINSDYRKLLSSLRSSMLE